MRTSKPPALATWLVEHLMPRGRNEGLAGDLLEQFSHGRSAAWYWRQALAAILIGFSRELPMLVVAVGVTGLWVGALAQLIVYGRAWISSTAIESVLGWGVRLPWPASLGFAFAFTMAFITAINAVPLLTALSIYLVVMRSFSF